MIQFAGANQQPSMSRWAYPILTMLDIEDDVLAATLGLASGNAHRQQEKNEPSSLLQEWLIDCQGLRALVWIWG